MIYSPLEQFQIYPLISIQLGNFDFSYTNGALIISIGLISFLIGLEMLMSQQNQIYFIPKTWQLLIETLYETVSAMVVDNVGEKGQKYFPFIASVEANIWFTTLFGAGLRSSINITKCLPLESSNNLYTSKISPLHSGCYLQIKCIFHSKIHEL